MELRKGIDYIGTNVVFVCHDGKGNVLLHKRSNNCRDERGNWDVGGGSQRFGEPLEKTVVREVQEEYGVTPYHILFVKTYDALRRLDDGTPTHWLATVWTCQVDHGKVRNNEPDKIDEIGWFTLNSLPNPLHSQTLHTLRSSNKYLLKDKS